MFTNTDLNLVLDYSLRRTSDLQDIGKLNHEYSSNDLIKTQSGG